MASIGLLSIGFFLVAIALTIRYRNPLVYHERMRVTRLVSDLAQDDIAAGRPWRWRYEALESLTYNQMMYQFWRPVKSFYRNHPALREER